MCIMSMERNNMKKNVLKKNQDNDTEIAEAIPLNKAIAHAGVCSRRAAVELIEKGFVTVNNKMVRNPAQKVSESDIVKVRGKIIRTEKKVYIALNKPKGFITTVSDDVNRKTIMNLVTNKDGVRLYPIGRLDVNTTGIILLTNDGGLAQTLAHPRYEMEKEYVVTLHKPLHEEDQKRIVAGMKLQDGSIAVDELSFPVASKRTVVRVAIHSGRYRIIRRMFESVGYMVEKLDRVSYAGIGKRGLAVSEWRYLSPSEVRQLKGLAAKKAVAAAARPKKVKSRRRKPFAQSKKS